MRWGLTSPRRHYSPSSDNAALLAADSNIISDEQDSYVPGITSGLVLLRRETKVQGITSIVHHDDQTALFSSDELEAAADLSDIGRGKDVTADGGVEKPWTNKARMSRFVAGATSGEEGYFGVGRGGVDYCNVSLAEGRSVRGVAAYRCHSMYFDNSWMKRRWTSMTHLAELHQSGCLG